MKDFRNYTKTKTGIQIENIVYNRTAHIWLGMAYNESDKQMRSCAWFPSGKCINRNRQEFDLK